jgi:RNA polymerase sigma-70 factor (ECF subfamily)
VIYRWALRFVGNHDEAEDIAQEVCLRCLLRQSAFRGESEFATWLHRVMVNVCKDHLRKKRRRKESVATEVGEEAFRAAQEAQAWAQATDVGTQAIVERARAALAQLTPRQCQLLIWKYVEDDSHAEIAQRLGIKERSAWVAAHRAREKFKKIYESLDEEGS